MDLMGGGFPNRVLGLIAVILILLVSGPYWESFGLMSFGFLLGDCFPDPCPSLRPIAFVVPLVILFGGAMLYVAMWVGARRLLLAKRKPANAL